MGAAPGRAKTCKIMQIAFVRTSNSLPLTLVLPLPPAAPSPVRRLSPIPSSHLSFSISLSRVHFLFSSRFLSSLFLLFSSLFLLSLFLSLLILRALLLRPATSIAVVRAILFYLPVDPARARASVKNVSTIVCRGVCSFIFAEGVEYQAGRGCRCRRRAPGDETSPAIFTSLCREWEAEKSPGNREIRRSSPLSLISPARVSDNG